MTRIYEIDAYRRTVDTTVRSCHLGDGGHEVVLADALLYPGGGGQPADRGWVDDQPVRTLWVDDNGEVVHVLPAPVGKMVTVRVDWTRRFDHMQQHTAQHIITVVAQRDLGLRTTAFHIGDTLCDIEFDTSHVSSDDLAALEQRVNEHVRELLPVRLDTGTEAEVESGAIRSRRLPSSLSGPLRVVTIEGLDRNTCGGTHVANTGELQLVALLGTERLSRSFRVYYAAGERVRRRVETWQTREEAFKRLLSCGSDEHETAITHLQDDLRAERQHRRMLAEEVARQTASTIAQATQEGIFLQLPGADADMLRRVAQAVRDAAPAKRVLLAARELPTPFVLVGPSDWVDARLPALLESMSGRGGGRDGFVQGRAARLPEEKLLGLLRHA